MPFGKEMNNQTPDLGIHELEYQSICLFFSCVLCFQFPLE